MATPMTAGTRNIAAVWPESSAASDVPPRMATEVIRPRMPPTRPRWWAGIWSGSSAVSVASVALTPNCASAQPAVRVAMLVPSATTVRPARPPSMPPISQGRRRPKRDVVRSLIAPKNGLPIRARIAPTDSTALSADVLLSGAICATRIDNVTTTGVRIVR